MTEKFINWLLLLPTNNNLRGRVEFPPSIQVSIHWSKKYVDCSAVHFGNLTGTNDIPVSLGIWQAHLILGTDGIKRASEVEIPVIIF